MSTAPSFSVIPGAQVRRVLRGREAEVVQLVESAYRLHAEGRSVNPPSYFLRFPDRPSSRIIALPASLGGAAPVDGLKWIASFPGNVAEGLPRASARADPQRPRDRLSVRLSGGIGDQRRADGRDGGQRSRLAQPWRGPGRGDWGSSAPA